MNHDERNAELVKLCLAGDSEAGDTLITENRPLVKATVRRVLNKWPSYSHLRDDLESEGLLALTKVVREMTEPLVSFRNLVITAVRNACLKIFQGNKQPYYVEHRTLNVGLENLPDEAIAVECQEIRTFEDQEFLLSCCISEKEEQVLTLYFQGGTPQSIATALGFTINVVKHTMSRFRKRVRRQHNLA